jgi:hypothetical protein
MNIYHNGTEITAYILGYTTEKTICSGVGVARIDLVITYPTTINLFDTFTIYEDGIKKGTYFCHTVNKDLPSGVLSASCQDASLKLEEYFIAESYYIDYPSDSAEWIAKFLGDATVSYSFDTAATGSPLNNDTTLGMMSAMDQIIPLLQQNGWYIRFDADNVCHVGKLDVNLESYDLLINDEDILSINTANHDKLFRNRAVVWGKGNPTQKRWVFADINQTGQYDNEYPGGNDTRTVVVANSNIATTSSAKLVANQVLKEFTQTNFEVELELVGFHNLDLGNVVIVNSDYIHTAGVVTTVGSNVTDRGKVTVVKLNERCPRLFGFYEHDGYVYVGTHGAGVWRKPLKYVHTWENFSTGLTDLNIKDLAIQNGTFACVTDDGKLFTRYLGDSGWGRIAPSLQDPVTSGWLSSSLTECTSCSIDKTTGNVLATFAPTVSGYKGWVVDAASRSSYRTYSITDEAGEYEYRPTGIDNNGTEDVIVVESEGGFITGPYNNFNGYSVLNDVDSQQLNGGYNMITLSGVVNMSSPDIAFRGDENYAYEIYSTGSVVRIKEIELETGTISTLSAAVGSFAGGDANAKDIFLLGNRVLYGIIATVSLKLVVIKYDMGKGVWTGVATVSLYDDTVEDYFDYYINGSAGFTTANDQSKIIAFLLYNKTDDGTRYAKVFYYDIELAAAGFTAVQQLFSTYLYPPWEAYSSLYLGQQLVSTSTGDKVSLLVGNIYRHYDEAVTAANLHALLTFNHSNNTLLVNESFNSLFDLLSQGLATFSAPNRVACVDDDFYVLAFYSKLVNDVEEDTLRLIRLTMGSSGATVVASFYGYDTYDQLCFDDEDVYAFARDAIGAPNASIYNARTGSKLGTAIEYSSVSDLSNTIADGSNIWMVKSDGTNWDLYKFNLNTGSITKFADQAAINSGYLFPFGDCLIHAHVQLISSTHYLFTRIYVPNTRKDPSVTPIARDCLKGHKGTYRKVRALTQARKVEINHYPIMVYGGVTYNGLGGAYAIGELLLSPIAESGTFSLVLLDSTKSYVSDVRSMRWMALDEEGELESKTYVVFPRLTNYDITDTNTELTFIDVTTDIPPVVYASGILASGISIYQTFSGYANHIETTNTQDFPYMFVSISGENPVFYQKDAHDWGEEETIFVDRTNNLPLASITCIRTDDDI